MSRLKKFCIAVFFQRWILIDNCTKYLNLDLIDVDGDQHKVASEWLGSNKLLVTGPFSQTDSIAYFDKVLTNDCVNSVLAYDIRGLQLSAMVARK